MIRSFIKEFKNFAVKGNMIDMAIGIILGTAFNNVVNALVKKVFLPPVSLFTGEVNLENRKLILREAAEGVDEVAILYGELIEVFIDFTIIAITVFIVVKAMNRFKSRAEDPEDKAEETPKNIQLLSNIERLLDEQNRLLKQSKD
ncbi:MAG: large conductance mechanosensitive channel protein MscL [Bacteroidia bacterium]|nr:large conductance mechanosensitive channel protein MscL [Bacteroidia bacterium]NNM23660.1 large conductance mechanosensitive channel protein MscL [Flavobacteriaceae bacterium]